MIVGNVLYSCEQLFLCCPHSSALHYILSSLPECLEFLIDTTGEVSVNCMLSFSYENSINVYRFIAQVAYQLALALHTDLHEQHNGIFILILLQINYSFSLSKI